MGVVVVDKMAAVQSGRSVPRPKSSTFKLLTVVLLLLFNEEVFFLTLLIILALPDICR